MRKPKLIISKCLNSEKCRYNGQSYDDKVISLLRKYVDLETLNTSQYCNTLEATMISTLVTSDHIPQYNQPIVKPSDESTNLVEYELKEPETG